jgi:phosphoglycolate phosphatase-like HAD superfamily hydrolase
MTAIYFDLDGTLTDPKLGITRSVQYALSNLDRTAPPEDELTWRIGPPLCTSLKNCLAPTIWWIRRCRFIESGFADIGIFENETLRRNCYSRPRSVARQLYAFRNPPAWASSSEQNQRSGLVRAG